MKSGSMLSRDSLNVVCDIQINNKSYKYFSLSKAAEALGINLKKLPYSIRVLLENVLRGEDGKANTQDTLDGFVEWQKQKSSTMEIGFNPARVLMQDFTGVPAVVDLAAMRDAVASSGGDPMQINPLIPVDLVIDHSVQVDHSGTADAFQRNVDKEMQRNHERYEFLKWGQEAFSNFRVVPPGTGICHQVNLEYLSQVVFERDGVLGVDSLVGTDSHTTMVNGLAVLGWGVGGIEAEAAMLGQPLSMLIPEVVGVKLIGVVAEGVTATDVVLTITEKLRAFGVVGKFVEFCGEGVKHLTLADRATIANMAPEYGATCGFFPIDDESIRYMDLTARDKEHLEIVESYIKEQSLWLHEGDEVPEYTHLIEVDLSEVEASLAGPKRPQDRVSLKGASQAFEKVLPSLSTKNVTDCSSKYSVSEKDYQISDGDVVIAAITSCTNTSNPSVLVAAGLVAKKAIERGLTKQPWVKASLAPGSQVVTEYLSRAGLDQYLDQLGFNNVGYGCTTCIGNSGPLAPEIESAISDNDMVACSVLSGNRNFEGRVHPLVRANYLASPPLVVAYAIFGKMSQDILTESLGNDHDGNPVYLKDLWPSNAEISECISTCVTREMFAEKYADVFSGDASWKSINVTNSPTYNWSKSSTYINNPPYFVGMGRDLREDFDVHNARLLGVFGDSITTDHISPAGNIAKGSVAAKYLESEGVPVAEYNSYGARRGNHEVMMRGTFANIRVRNLMCPGVEGGVTVHQPSGAQMSIYDAAMSYIENDTPLVVFGGKEYGTGSSRDWAAKGTCLLGVKAVITESFERIHRSNLVGMGVVPMTLKSHKTNELLLDGSEVVDLELAEGEIKPYAEFIGRIQRSNGDVDKITLQLEVYTDTEIEYLRNGGVLHKMVRSIL